MTVQSRRRLVITLLMLTLASHTHAQSDVGTGLPGKNGGAPVTKEMLCADPDATELTKRECCNVAKRSGEPLPSYCPNLCQDENGSYGSRCWPKGGETSWVACCTGDRICNPDWVPNEPGPNGVACVDPKSLETTRLIESVPVDVQKAGVMGGTGAFLVVLHRILCEYFRGTQGATVNCQFCVAHACAGTIPPNGACPPAPFRFPPGQYPGLYKECVEMGMMACLSCGAKSVFTNNLQAPFTPLHGDGTRYAGLGCADVG